MVVKKSMHSGESCSMTIIYVRIMNYDYLCNTLSKYILKMSDVYFVNQESNVSSISSEAAVSAAVCKCYLRFKLAFYKLRRWMPMDLILLMQGAVAKIRLIQMSSMIGFTVLSAYMSALECW